MQLGRTLPLCAGATGSVSNFVADRTNWGALSDRTICGSHFVPGPDAGEAKAGGPDLAPSRNPLVLWRERPRRDRLVDPWTLRRRCDSEFHRRDLRPCCPPKETATVDLWRCSNSICQPVSLTPWTRHFPTKATIWSGLLTSPKAGATSTTSPSTPDSAVTMPPRIPSRRRSARPSQTSLVLAVTPFGFGGPPDDWCPGTEGRILIDLLSKQSSQSAVLATGDPYFKGHLSHDRYRGITQINDFAASMFHFKAHSETSEWRIFRRPAAAL